VRATQPYNDGSSFYMAMAVGADLVDLGTSISPSYRDHAHVLVGNGPSVGPNDIGPGGAQAWMPYNMYQAGAIIVNTAGKRYVNEQGSTLGTTVENQPGKVSFVVFDKPVADIFNKWPMVVSSLPGIGEKSGWGAWCSVDDLVFRGNIQVANTWDEVVAKVTDATKIQISASGLKDTIDKWNGYAANGKDPEFGRTTFGMDILKGAGIKVPPFYIEGPCASEIQNQRISLVVDTKLRVYSFWGKVIPRLYACGNIGSNRGGVVAGHGGQVSWTFTSGRLVGKTAAAETPQT
jgi:3-oxosteroid 1-dehydrogenase